MTTFTVNTTIIVPTPPRKFKVNGSKRQVPVGEVGEQHLREIGAAWTEALVKEAQRQRGTK